MKNFHSKDLLLFPYIIVLIFICYDNSRIQENKNKTTAQALKKLLNNPYVKKGAKILDYNPWLEKSKK